MAKLKKVNTTTSKRKGRAKKLESEKFQTLKVPIAKGRDAFKEMYPEERQDIEKIGGPIDDAASKHRYPPPRKHERFRQVWMQFVDDIASRTNFKPGHLNALEVLCDLYVDYDDLREFLRTKGTTYKVIGRQGVQYKDFPQVDRLRVVQNQIKDYLKMLGLVLKNTIKEDSGRDAGEWS